MKTKDYVRKLVKSDGSVLEYPPAGKVYTLEELQKAVGGYIEIVPLEQGYLMVLNEEGKLQGLPANKLATDLYNNPHDFIVGDVVVCLNKDIE